MTAREVMVEYRFCGYRLDVRHRKLFRPDGVAVSLSSRAFDTLLVLLAKQGETLSKAQLMEAVWPNSVVEENNLNQAIYSLRKALGDSTTENNFILTLPGRGYCFVAPVEVCSLPDSGIVTAAAAPPEMLPDAAAADAPPMHLAGSGRNILPTPLMALFLVFVAAGSLLYLILPAPKDDSEITASLPPAATPDLAQLDIIANSIAVLPFTDLNPAADSGLFALGLHDEVINQLSKISSLRVIARDSVLALAAQQYSLADMANLLRVQSLMSGTILIAGDQARISLQMLDAHTGITLWSGSYDANKQDLAEMISIQSDIAMRVASTLEAEIEQSERDTIAALPTQSFEAYRYNMAARNAHFHQDYTQEWHLARQAMELDPGYFDAIDTFSSVNAVLVATPLPGMSSREHFELALDSAQRMIELAPRRSEGYALKAVALGTSKDWLGVSAVLEELNSMNVPASDLKYIALLLICLGDFDRAIEIYEANLVTEPLNLYGRGFLIAAHEMAGNRMESRNEFNIGEELSPAWWGDTVNIFLALGRDEPLQDVEELVGISAELKYMLGHSQDAALVETGLQTFYESGNKVSAESVYYAALAARAGQHERSVEFMRFALGDVWTGLFWLWLPVFDETRRLQSFRELLVDSGVVDYWRQKGWPEVCQPEGDSFSCNWNAYPGVSAAY